MTRIDDKIERFNELTDEDCAPDFMRFMTRSKVDAPLLEQTSGRARLTGERYTSVVGGKYTLTEDFVDYLDGDARTVEQAENLKGVRREMGRGRRRIRSARYAVTHSQGKMRDTSLSVRLRKRLMETKPLWAQSVEMVCFQGMKQLEVSRLLGVHHSTVKYRLEQGLDLLLEWAERELRCGTQ